MEAGKKPYLKMNSVEMLKAKIYQTGYKKRENSILENTNKSKWDRRQNLKYIEFLKLNGQALGSSSKKENRVFVRMAQFLQTRSRRQCKGHHEKMIQSHKTIQRIIAHTEMKCQLLSQQEKLNEKCQPPYHGIPAQTQFIQNHIPPLQKQIKPQQKQAIKLQEGEEGFTQGADGIAFKILINGSQLKITENTPNEKYT